MLIQKRSENRRFSQTNLAGDGNKPFFFLYSIDQRTQRLFVAGTEIQKIRIRGGIKRFGP